MSRSFLSSPDFLCRSTLRYSRHLKMPQLLPVLLCLLVSCSDKGAAESATALPTATVELPEQQASLAFEDFVDEKLLRYTSDSASLQELRPFVPPDYLLYQFDTGDLNNDGLSDYIILLRHKEGIYQDEPVPLLLCIRQQDNSLKAATRNLSIPSYFIDLLWLEPDSTGAGFSVGFAYAGMGRHAIATEETIHFLYDQKAGQWILNSLCRFEETLGGSPLYDEHGELVLDEDGLEMQDTTAFEKPPVILLPDGRECISYQTQKDFGRIPFTKYNFGHLFDSEEPMAID